MTSAKGKYWLFLYPEILPVVEGKQGHRSGQELVQTKSPPGSPENPLKNSRRTQTSTVLLVAHWPPTVFLNMLRSSLHGPCLKHFAFPSSVCSSPLSKLSSSTMNSSALPFIPTNRRQKAVFPASPPYTVLPAVRLKGPLVFTPSISLIRRV